MKLARLALVALSSLLLASCLLTPGRFTSSLHIERDRSFRFAYAGEVHFVDERSGQSDSAGACAEGDEACDANALAAETSRKEAEQDAKLREIAEALGREPGYRSVEYLGNRLFRVDYAIEGRLDRNFVYPFNSDAAAIFPWIAIELRKDGSARVKAPGFGDGEEGMAPAGANPLGEPKREGEFTFTTNADLVMQNEEGGVTEAPGGMKRIVWRVSPASRTVPTAVVRFPN